MPLLTVEGVYKDGRIELLERPEGIAEGTRVLVIFLPPGSRLGNEAKREPGKESPRNPEGGHVMELPEFLRELQEDVPAWLDEFNAESEFNRGALLLFPRRVLPGAGSTDSR